MTRLRRRGMALVAGVALAGVGCGETSTAPGACPEFCPPESIELVDTVFTGAIASDSTFTGFVRAHEASGIQLVNDSSGATAAAPSRGVIRFLPFPERVLIQDGDTTTGPVLATDSFRVRLFVDVRNPDATSLEIAIHRLPISVDTATSYASLDPFFEDSTLLALAPVPDTLTTGSIEAMLPGDAFPSLDPDGRRAAIGVVLRSADPTFVTLGTLEAARGAQLSRFMQVQASDGPVERSVARPPALDTYLGPATPSPAADVLRVGGTPASRAVLRLALPSRVVDSAAVARATLVLVPTEGVLGAPGDSAVLIAQGVTADVGAKSPLALISADSLLLRTVGVQIGSTDTIRIDITDLIRGFRLLPDRPRLIVVRALPEGAGFAEVRFGSTTRAGARPAIEITYMPPVDLGFR